VATSQNRGKKKNTVAGSWSRSKVHPAGDHMCEVDRFLARDWFWWGRKEGGGGLVGSASDALVRQGRWNASGDQITTCEACEEEYNETGAHVTYAGLPQVFIVIVMLHFLVYFLMFGFRYFVKVVIGRTARSTFLWFCFTGYMHRSFLLCEISHCCKIPGDFLP